MKNILNKAEDVRILTIKKTKEEIRKKYSQYLTPRETAEFACTLFTSATTRKLECLDLGAGTGMLSVAIANRYLNNISVDAYEIDSCLAQICADELKANNIDGEVFNVDVLSGTINKKYDRVILNPPYKKISPTHNVQSNIPVKVPNLYAAFLVIGLMSLKKGGELVAIIPRSWMNGQYYVPFRRWLIKNASIDSIHIYNSRTEIFKDTNVLQETLILKLSKQQQGKNVVISQSEGKKDSVVKTIFPFTDLVGIDGAISTTKEQTLGVNSFSTLKDSGFCASTGKIVDFRCRENIHSDYEEGDAKLFYPCNFYEGKSIHPNNLSDKPQWIFVDKKISSLLIGPGFFVVIKRFSPKEDFKRINAFVLEANEPIALENHLNYIHKGTSRKTVPLSFDEASTLCEWLNSEEINKWFKSRSGSTQVNASDLNACPYYYETALNK